MLYLTNFQHIVMLYFSWRDTKWLLVCRVGHSNKCYVFLGCRVYEHCIYKYLS